MYLSLNLAFIYLIMEHIFQYNLSNFNTFAPPFCSVLISLEKEMIISVGLQNWRQQFLLVGFRLQTDALKSYGASSRLYGGPAQLNSIWWAARVRILAALWIPALL